MKALVIYDSAYGNTEKIAQAVAHGLGAKAKLVREVNDKDLDSLDLLAFGSPTQGGRPLPSIIEFIDEYDFGITPRIHLAAFDTRFDAMNQKFALRLLMKTIGYAAEKIADRLRNASGKDVVKENYFIVNDKEGPLKTGEIERAKIWGKELARLI